MFDVDNTIVKLRFIDSFRFVPCSLEKLASYLTNDEKSITKKYCKNNVEFNLLTRKGVFPIFPIPILMKKIYLIDTNKAVLTKRLKNNF